MRRGTAHNVLWRIGRAVDGFGPFAIGAVASYYVFGIAIAALACIYIVDVIATVTLTRN